MYSITPPWKEPIYTVPTVRFPDGTYIMDSRRIAEAINERYPSPPLRIESKYYTWLEKNYGRLMTDLEGVYIPNIPRRLLNEASQPFWYETRSKAVGMPLDQLEEERGGGVAWGLVEPLLKEVAGMLRENRDGPFFLGKEVSYADFWWAGFLLFVKRIGGDLWEELLRRSGEDAKAHEELLEAVKPWSERNDH
jgi:glutathione S-transferase